MDTQPNYARLELSRLVASMPVSRLKPAARNARKHSKAQIAKISRSIERFGFVNPVLVDNENTIIAGHGRVAAAKLLGLTEVPTLSVTHLTKEDLRLYALADNRLAELAGWDDELLALEFEELSSVFGDIQLDITGFELPAIDLMLQERQQEPDPEDLVEAQPEDKPIVSRPGDVWILGDHKIICGNSLESATYGTLLGDEKAELVFCDPPYNVRIDGHVCGLGAVKHEEFAMASGEMSPAQFSEFLGVTARLLVEHSANGSVHYICMDWRHLHELMNGMSPHYGKILNVCVWDKSQGGMGSMYRSQHELIVVFKSGAESHINNIELGRHGRNRTNVWRYPGANSMSPGRAKKLALHPTIKPVALVADAILDASHRGGIVLDAFGGSGTTILAAERTWRCARLIEIDPKYVDVTVERWQSMTGRIAVHAASGRKFGEQ